MLPTETLDIVVPVFNEESCLPLLIARLEKLKETLQPGVETNFIFINDGSSDGTLGILQELASQRPHLRVLNFSRNFGHQIALTAGLDHSTADYAVAIDADLQDPPELIKDMIEKARNGYDVVYGQRLIRKGESWFKLATAKLFYRLFNRVCGMDIPLDTGDFRLIRRNVVEELKRMREKHRFIRGMIPWLGFRSAPIFYQRDMRAAGTTKYPFIKMARFAWWALLSFTSKPLHLATALGFVVTLFSFIASIFLLYLKIFTIYHVPGITATILAVLFMGGVQMLIVGILSEYIAMLFDEMKGRPLYVLQTRMNFENDEKR